MKILLWNDSVKFTAEVLPVLAGGGHIIFRENNPLQLLAAARAEEPSFIVLCLEQENEDLSSILEELANHPSTRWTPVLLLAKNTVKHDALSRLLLAGASALIAVGDHHDLLNAQIRAFERTVLQFSSLRSNRFIDDETGFYQQSFLEDQLKVFCRKHLRDGVAFCLLFLELRGTEEAIHTAAVHLAGTVRGADLFGRWERDAFAVLLPASTDANAKLLCNRLEVVLKSQSVDARCALISSDQGVADPEILIESAQNTLDTAWLTPGPFLWAWSDSEGAGIPYPVACP